jgi:hypothetical protein
VYKLEPRRRTGKLPELLCSRVAVQRQHFSDQLKDGSISGDDRAVVGHTKG